MLYELFAQRHPFRQDTAVATLAAILHDTPPLLSGALSEMPPALDGIIGRCLEKEPGERFASGHDLSVALEAVLQAPPGAVSLQEVEERSPYPGLRSFTEKDARHFFGREAEVAALWVRIRARRLLAVIGPSGAGKTSFVRAGAIPARPDGWAAIVCTPGTSPMRGLGQALGPALASDREALSQLAGFEDPDTAFALLSRWRQAHPNALLVVDQFEELFTLNPPEMQARFATLLARLASEADLHVVLSLRDDFLMRCHDQASLAPIFAEITPLGALTRQSLHRVLVEPATRLGYRFEEEALVEEMVACVEGARAALPLLAFAVSRLWEQRDRERKLLTRAAYEDIGGVAGALAQHAETTLERIGTPRHDLVREIFRNLVTAHGTRAVIDGDELLSAFPERAAAEAVLRDLVDARLLTSYEVEGQEGEPSRHQIEIVHESLLKAWPRLVRWQTQDEDGAQRRDQLKQAAHLWAEKGRTADLLWTGTAYREHALWRERYEAPLTAVEEAFAAAMAARAKRTRRVRTAAVAAVIVGLSAVAIAVGISRQAAIESARRAEASKLLALGQARLAEDPTEALALVTASLDAVDTMEARRFALRVLWESPPALEVRTGDTDMREPAFSPDGRRLAVAGYSGTARVWSDDAAGPVLLSGHEQTPSAPNIPRWASDKVLVTGLTDGLAERVRVWLLPEGKRVRTIEFGGTARWQVGGAALFAEIIERGSPERPEVVVLRSWQLPGGEPETLGRVDWRALSPSSSCFEPTGRAWLYTKGRELFLRRLPSIGRTMDLLLARFGEDATVHDSGRPGEFISRERSGALSRWSHTSVGLERAPVMTVPFEAGEESSPSPMERWWLEQPLQRPSARLWGIPSLPGARPLVVRRAGSWYLAVGTVHPKDEWVAITTHSASAITVWPIVRGFVSVVDGYASNRRPVRFSPDSRWLATGWSDARPRLWTVTGAGPGQVRVLEGPGPPDALSGLAFDSGGRYLFTTTVLGRATILPLNGDAPRSLAGFTSGTILETAAVSPSGRRVATAFNFGSGPRVLRVWDLETGESRSFPLPGTGSAAVQTLPRPPPATRAPCNRLPSRASPFSIRRARRGCCAGTSRRGPTKSSRPTNPVR